MDFSPKSNFAQGSSAQPWTDVASSALFREAAGVALLQMQMNQGYAGQMEGAAIKEFQMEGARMYLWIIMNLTTPPEEVSKKRPASENLKHDI